MAEIKVVPSGPYIVDGEDVVVIGRDGKARPIANRPIALCRCGATESEPFCDGSHTKIGFQLKA
jgi:CDGSH-type Zn-finger protein